MVVLGWHQSRVPLCLPLMGARQAVPITTSKSSHPSQLPSRQHLAPHRSFSCNTYESHRKCCKQKTYGLAKPFRCNTYKKPGVPPYGSEAGSSQLDFNRAKGAVFHESQVTSHQPAPTLSGSLAGRIGAAAVQGVPNV